MHEVTRILAAIHRGEPQASEALFPLVYEELRRLAAGQMAGETPGHPLQATALVHEAYIRLADVKDAPIWNSRGHFFAAAAEAMRRILVEYARRGLSAKRGGALVRQDVDLAVCANDAAEEIVAVHDALAALSADDSLAAEVVKLRYFGGFSIEEAADLLGISRATAYRCWTYARAWLREALADSPP